MDFLFLGLGNPPAYQGTRHNLGKDLVEGLVCEEQCRWHTVANGRVGVLPFGPHSVTCMVSDGFMNEIGQDMRGALLEINPARLVVVHDEVDLPVGEIRLSYNKSPGGHKGVASVAAALGTNAFFRLRIGIGRGQGDLKKYVLEMVPPADRETIITALHEMLPKIVSEKLSVQQQ